MVVALALGDEVDAAAAGGARAAWAAGWLTRDEGGAGCLPSSAHRQAALGGAPAALRAEVAARALLRLPGDDPRRADALAAAGRLDEAARLLTTQARAARKAVAYGRAADLLGRAAALAPERLEVDDWLDSGHRPRPVLGRYDEAAAALSRAQALATEEAAQTRCCEREGWLRTRRGDIAGACAALERGLARAEMTPVCFGRGSGACWSPPGDSMRRSRPSRRCSRAAASTARSPAQWIVRFWRWSPRPGAGARLRRRRRRGADTLAALSSTGQLDDARSGYLEALLAQLAGDDGRALDGYRRAYALAAGAADVHTVAAVTLNLGGLLAERASTRRRWRPARGRSVRSAVSARAELATALVNAANLFVQVGDLPAARRALDRARSRASDRKMTLALAAAAFVEGDAGAAPGARWRRSPPTGPPPRPSSKGGSRTSAPALCSRRRRRWSRRGTSRRAPSWRRRAALVPAVTPGGPEVGDAPTAMTPCGPAPAWRWPTEAGERTTAPCSARSIGSRGRPRRRAAPRRLAARRPGGAARRAGGRPPPPSTDVAASPALASRRSAWQRPNIIAPGWRRIPTPRGCWAAAPTGGDAALAARAAGREGQLRRLLRINKRLNSEQRLPRLLELIVDTVIELTDAERGFLLLEDDGGGGLQVKVARNIDQQTLGTAEFELSRSIAQQAAAGGEPIVTIDAAGDARFREALSVSDLHLRSVLAVRLRSRGRSSGTIYVDHRLRKGAFDQDDVRHVLDFAEQAAIALENARLLAELRRRERQVEALNRRLEAELAARREELSGMKQELRDNREALAVRYDYRNIVGRTPRMLELFRLLDRITDTALPVVIQGESGTGKELVARAIHSNGPRRERPVRRRELRRHPRDAAGVDALRLRARRFHRRRARQHAGCSRSPTAGRCSSTRSAEMSPGMQGKLLRVLQEGELRRVGSERTRKVDVRIVAATNRDLARMVDEGKFRRDLFFRLNVATIALPPLRDRREDIPLMVEHFLAKSAAAAGRHGAEADRSGGAGAALSPIAGPATCASSRTSSPAPTRSRATRITAADLSPARRRRRRSGGGRRPRIPTACCSSPGSSAWSGRSCARPSGARPTTRPRPPRCWACRASGCRRS